jgi:cytochrome bd-type quinol oxidase subunit 2
VSIRSGHNGHPRVLVLINLTAFSSPLGTQVFQDAGPYIRQTQPWLLVFPAIGALAAYGLWTEVRWRRDWLPYALTVVIFLAAYLTLVGSFCPYMIPFSVTLWDAAAPPQSLTFVFYGAGLLVFPVVLIYTVAVYWILRGKVRDGIDHS